MVKQKIPRVTPIMMKEQPSQFISIINRVIDEINED